MVWAVLAMRSSFAAHDEVIFVQAFDLLGPQRDGRVLPHVRKEASRRGRPSSFVGHPMSGGDEGESYPAV
jgi:hypothetical protein